ncbi:mulitcopper oxidase domain protein [Pedobacter sp. BAL39]|uniref:c-type cytochrome n=1 Tax=Pedobacter sp. BAL39 TaxID=391596 RepID=UPI000155A018|nr:cytochrome c [Pedobacter sp. BAL39]EDM36809.1 mulitcopper oxidase domain protein [Pedobacter sp. BAL39]
MRKVIICILSLSCIATIIYSCQNANQIKQDVYYVNGRDIYIKNCQNCHGSNGEGLAALSPPLTDSIFLKANKHQIACFIKNGINTKITVAGRNYEENMPAVDHLADIDIAQVIVYVTNNFGNRQGMYTPEQVKADLNKCK